MNFLGGGCVGVAAALAVREAACGGTTEGRAAPIHLPPPFRGETKRGVGGSAPAAAVGWVVGVGNDWLCACSRAFTPHLTSPLRGGRDELGE